MMKYISSILYSSKKKIPPISSETLREPSLLNEQTTYLWDANLVTQRAH